ncbi:helix-turn-helix domain-containing protein [Burkholderia sp. 4701]|nr:helix-turn-helix domain-containing protein [Burkholderia sp. 4701]MXN85012.1 helix-turn-helix domain-containing protein [Burkholderia sp. 4812]
MSAPMLFEFSTLPYAPQDKLDAWREQSRLAEIVSGSCGVSDESVLDSEFVGIHANQIMIGTMNYTVKFHGDSISYDAIRCKKRIREDGFDHYAFRTSRSSVWRASKFDSVESVQPHQVAVADLTQPYQINVGAGSFVAVIVPRRMIPFDLAARHGAVMGGTIATLASQYLNTLSTNLRGVTAAEIPSIAQATLGMLTAMLMPTPDNLREAQSELKVEMFERVKEHINAHLASPELSVESICKNVGLSRASLYRLFSENNLGVSEYIKLARLRKIYAILSSPDGRKQRLPNIAYQYGFYDVPSLTRDFRKYFGSSPKDVQYSIWGANTVRKAPSGALTNDYWSWHYA